MFRIILFLLFPIALFSKESSVQYLPDSLRTLTLSVCPGEMFFGYQGIQAEYKISPHFKVGLSFGQIFRSKYYGWGNKDDERPWLAYDGNFIRLNGKYIFNSKSMLRPFFEMQVTGKELYYSWLNFLDALHGADDEIGFTKSEHARQIALINNFGFERFIGERFFYEMYLGLSVNRKYRNCTQYSYRDWAGHYDGTVYHKTETQTFILPNIGFKFGFLICKMK